MEIRVSVSGADRFISRLKSYQKSLKNKQKKLLERLAEIGIDVASAKFSTAQYDGENDVIVGKVPQWSGEDKLIISATGNSITFIEFGTGVHFTEQHPKAVDFGYTRGGYGHHLGLLDSWRYKGVRGSNGEPITEGSHAGEIITHGNPPARAMYDAGKEMRNKIVEIAREVFSSD